MDPTLKLLLNTRTTLEGLFLADLRLERCLFLGNFLFSGLTSCISIVIAPYVLLGTHLGIRDGTLNQGIDLIDSHTLILFQQNGRAQGPPASLLVLCSDQPPILRMMAIAVSCSALEMFESI